MRDGHKEINARIYKSTISYLEEKIRVYEETYESIDECRELRSAKAECKSRLDSCREIMDAFMDTFTPGAHSRKREKIGTGDLTESV